MVDLNEAGSRLAGYRIGAEPDLDDIRERAARHTRTRRRQRSSGAAVLVAAVALLGVLTVTSLDRGDRPQRVTVGGRPSRRTPAPNATSASGGRHPAGSRPVDLGRIRLWLPAGWTVSGSQGGQPTRCAQHFTDRVAIDASSSRLPCGQGGPRLIVAPFRNGVPTADLVARTIDGVSVLERNPALSVAGITAELVEVPSLHVVLWVYPGSSAVLDTIGPSALRAVVAARYPVAVPAGWKRVTLDGFFADVPPSWPIQHALTVRTGRSTSVTGLRSDCGGGSWRKPTAYVGDEGGGCPDVTTRPAPRLGANAPVDGLWLRFTTVSQTASDTGGIRMAEPAGILGFPHVSYTGGGIDFLDVQLTEGGRTLTTTVGLGADPLVAEAVISSLGAST